MVLRYVVSGGSLISARQSSSCDSRDHDRTPRLFKMESQTINIFSRMQSELVRWHQGKCYLSRHPQAQWRVAVCVARRGNEGSLLLLEEYHCCGTISPKIFLVLMQFPDSTHCIMHGFGSARDFYIHCCYFRHHVQMCRHLLHSLSIGKQESSDDACLTKSPSAFFLLLASDSG